MTVRRPMHLVTDFAVTGSHATGGELPAEPASRILAGYRRACHQLGHPEEVLWEGGESLDGTPTAGPSSTSQALRNGGHLSATAGRVRYTAPDSTTPWRAMCWDAVGVLILRRAQSWLAEPDLVVRKVAVGPDGRAHACDERYDVAPTLAAADLRAALLPFLVTRQVLCGAGLVRSGGDGARLAISQRAGSIRRVLGPVDAILVEGHGGGTVHVACGDANRMPASTLLKLGTTSLVLGVLEHRGSVPPEWAALTLADPLREMAAVAGNPRLDHRLLLADGRRLTALEVQRAYADVVANDLLAVSDELVRSRSGDGPLPSEVTAQGAGDAFPPIPGVDDDTRESLDLWNRTLGLLARDPVLAAGSVEWAAKLAMLRAGDVEPAELEDRWSDLRRGRSLVTHLEESNSLDHVVHPEVLAAAEFAPPPDTRAWLRGELIRRWPDRVRAASLSAIEVDLGSDGVVRVPIPGPLSGSRAEAARVVTAAGDIAEVARVLLRAAGVRDPQDAERQWRPQRAGAE